MGGFGKRAAFALAAVCVALTGPVQAQPAPAPAAPAAPASAPIDRARFAAFIDGAIGEPLASRNIAGVTFSAIDRQGVIMARGYGEAAPDRPTDADSLFRVGSISKTFVWIALMQLAEQGKLTLEDPVNDHLPLELQIPDEGFSEPIRIQHLMNHTPGFEDSGLGHLFVRDAQQLLPAETYLARFRVHRVRPPGEISSYSNYGATLAGAIVAHESGMDWPTYAEQKILRPLGMTLSTFREPYSAEIAQARGLPAPMSADAQAHLNSGYELQAGALVATPFEFITQNSSAGALSSNANEMALYMQALLDPAVMARAGVLSAQSALQLREETFSNSSALGAWRHGFITYNLGGGRWAYGHTGGTMRQTSIVLVSPELGFGMFLSTNSAEGGVLIGSVAEAAIREFYPTDAPPAPRVENAAAESARVVGSYLLTRRAYHRSESAFMRITSQLNVLPAPDGDIFTLAGQGPIRLHPIGNGVFEADDGITRLAFEERDGKTVMLRGEMVGERVGFFETVNWLVIIGGLGALVAAWGVFAGAQRLLKGKETRGALIFDALALLWFVGLGLTVAATMTLGPVPVGFMFNYPGPLLPIALWLLAAAAAATPLALLLALFVWRPKDWSWLRWTRAGSAIAVFGALALTLGSWGFLGYSGF